MKTFLCPTIIAVIVFVTGCGGNNQADSHATEKKDDRPQSPAATTGNPDKGSISFKVNGSLVQTSAWNISEAVIMNGAYTINISSNMHQDGRTILININGDTAGHYSFVHDHKTEFKRGIAYGGYRPDYLKEMLNVYHFETGEFIILSLNRNDGTLSGTFYGKVKNDKGDEAEITEGKVEGKIKSPPRGTIN